MALQAATLRVRALEEELAEAKREQQRLETVELPAAFTEDGISELRLPDGQKAARSVSVQGSFPDADHEDHEFALTWATENGLQDTIRCVVAANYSAGDREAALAEYERLRGDNRAFVTKGETVHPMTWKAVLLQRVKDGEPTPLERLGCVVLRRVKLTTPPRRRSQSTGEDHDA